MKFFIKDFFNKRDQIRRILRIWSYLLKKSYLLETFLFMPRTSKFHEVKFRGKSSQIFSQAALTSY